MKRKLNLWHKKYKSKSNFLSCLLLFHSTSPLQPLPWNLMLPLQKGICSLWSNCAQSWFWAHLSSVWVFIFIFHNPSQHCLLCKVCQMERVISEMVDHHVPYRLQTYGETILENMPWRKKNHLIFEFIILQGTSPVYCSFNYYFEKKKKSFEEEAFVGNSFHHFWLWKLFYGSHNSICFKKKNKKSLYDISVVIHELRPSVLLVLDTNKNHPFKYHFWKVIYKCIIKIKHRAQKYMKEAWGRKQSF